MPHAAKTNKNYCYKYFLLRSPHLHNHNVRPWGWWTYEISTVKASTLSSRRLWLWEGGVMFIIWRRKEIFLLQVRKSTLMDMHVQKQIYCKTYYSIDA